MGPEHTDAIDLTRCANGDVRMHRDGSGHASVNGKRTTSDTGEVEHGKRHTPEERDINVDVAFAVGVQDDIEAADVDTDASMGMEPCE